MNREKILRVAEVLDYLQHGYGAGRFSLTSYSHACGAPACIAGWTIALEASDFNVEKAAHAHVRNEVSLRAHRDDSPWSITEQARNILGLGTNQARELFIPEVWPKDSSPKQASLVLRNLAKRGRVEWDWRESHES